MYDYLIPLRVEGDLGRPRSSTRAGGSFEAVLDPGTYVFTVRAAGRLMVSLRIADVDRAERNLAKLEGYRKAGTMVQIVGPPDPCPPCAAARARSYYPSEPPPMPPLAECENDVCNCEYDP